MGVPEPIIEQRYTGLAIAFHWLVALLIIAGFTLGLTMVDMKLSPTKLKYFSWHKWIGITVFLLAALRLLWRQYHPAPPLPSTMPHWQRVAAHGSHVLLYLLMFIIPISGWLYSSAAGVPVVYLGLIPLPDLVAKDKELADILKFVHHQLNWLLLGLVIAHVGAALKHHFFDRDDVLKRMLPARKRVPLIEPKPTEDLT